ncbi:uncharacterized protein FOMMEDRAFT_149903 [Fomitiporia mediterranea MF3/22]|uniref:uncharacterized protein n=1 Tax=Fomitiporia mediterranea (strain MF3/22) TaxID=694068 RepID=UPI0004407E07|nr:uncharacterized protein FOMMEDRAFT_149903 [Fomitiporia mediterranea MF3/22]EJD07381.1 hypothetical protein FOMMEDRAFT_149903 [Fomitiporia mediterranea MF3/22]
MSYLEHSSAVISAPRSWQSLEMSKNTSHELNTTALIIMNAQPRSSAHESSSKQIIYPLQVYEATSRINRVHYHLSDLFLANCISEARAGHRTFRVLILADAAKTALRVEELGSCPSQSYGIMSKIFDVQREGNETAGETFSETLELQTLTGFDTFR